VCAVSEAENPSEAPHLDPSQWRCHASSYEGVSSRLREATHWSDTSHLRARTDKDFYLVLLASHCYTSDSTNIVIGNVTEFWWASGVQCTSHPAWWFNRIGGRQALLYRHGPHAAAFNLLCAFWATYEGTGNTVKV
jgi:hypothetical protein